MTPLAEILDIPEELSARLDITLEDAKRVRAVVSLHVEMVNAAKKLEDGLAPHQFGVNEVLRKAITQFRSILAKAEPK